MKSRARFSLVFRPQVSLFAEFLFSMCKSTLKIALFHKSIKIKLLFYHIGICQLKNNSCILLFYISLYSRMPFIWVIYFDS